MKKSIISIIVALIIMVGGTWYEQKFVLKTFDELRVEIGECLTKANNEVLTKKEVEDFQKKWEDKKKYLHIFIPHTDIREIGLWVSEAIAFTEYENFEESADKLKVIYDLLISTPQNYRFKIENVL